MTHTCRTSELITSLDLGGQGPYQRSLLDYASHTDKSLVRPQDLLRAGMLLGAGSALDLVSERLSRCKSNIQHDLDTELLSTSSKVVQACHKVPQQYWGFTGMSAPPSLEAAPQLPHFLNVYFG